MLYNAFETYVNEESIAFVYSPTPLSTRPMRTWDKGPVLSGLPDCWLRLRAMNRISESQFS